MNLRSCCCCCLMCSNKIYHRPAMSTESKFHNSYWRGHTRKFECMELITAVTMILYRESWGALLFWVFEQRYYSYRTNTDITWSCYCIKILHIIMHPFNYESSFLLSRFYISNDTHSSSLSFFLLSILFCWNGGHLLFIQHFLIVLSCRWKISYAKWTELRLM